MLLSENKYDDDDDTQGNPSKFLDETYLTKTRGMGLLYSEN